MSRLYLTESGRVVPTLCEELTSFRRARKLLHLPPTAATADLYLLARPHAGSGLPLRLSVNGEELSPFAPGPTEIYTWYRASIPSSLLHEGENQFELWTDASAMIAWSLAIEPGFASPASFISDDSGRSWRNERMGYLNVLRGEYVIRLRLAEVEDPPPPALVWEDPSHPRLEQLRQIIPATATPSGPVLGRVRALTAWISTAWEYTNSDFAAQYAPWDPETILAWGAAKIGHDGRRPIVMCVHYAVVFGLCRQALGIPARCAVCTADLAGGDGHFTAEVWFPEYGKWVMVDPNMDALFLHDGIPMSVPEIQRVGGNLGDRIEWGPGTEDQLRNPAISRWIEGSYRRGTCFRHRALWPRADFFSRPELTPPAHGALAYCESDLVWEACDRDKGFGMFNRFAEAEYFARPPG